MLLLAVLIGGYFSAYAQMGEVKGTITDAADGTPLPGATVVVKGTARGTVTNIDGNFTINVEPNSVLAISYVGYTSQEVEVQPNTTVSIELAEDALALEEFVVIGYGVQKKEDATGSVSAIDTKEFNQGSVLSAANLLSGKVAGVQIISDGGAPGAALQVRIRGGSSLSAVNDPLYVIDGVPYDSEGVDGARNPLNSINPNDIESFTVLKDASATAIYGSRASNGVIMITTKKGVSTSPFRIEYSGKFSLYTPTRKIEVLGAERFREIINERQPTHVDMLGESSTDWQEEIFKTAFGQDHYLNFSGSVNNLPYRVSLGYTDQDGILRTDNMKRTTLGFKLNPSLFDDHLKIDLNGQGNYTNNRFADRGAIGGAIQFDPTKPIFDSESPYGGYWAWTQPNGDPVTQATTNPVALLELKEDISDVYGFTGNAQFDYKVHNFEDLRLNLNLGYSYSNSEGTVYIPEFAAWEYYAGDDRLGGVNRMYDQEKKNELLEFYANYAKDLESINSRFDVMAGYSYQRLWRQGTTYETNIFTDTANRVVNEDTDYATENILISFYGRLNYTLMDRYLLTFTLRNDHTSRFSPDTRSGVFPSVAFAWKIKEESFLQDVDVLSQLKLRLGWGITGQQNINQGDYPYLPRYTYSETNARYQLGQIFYQTLRAEGYDANIKWEETTTYNAGIDFGFADDRYYGSIDVYLRQTDDLINFIPVPAGSNLTNFILTNVGDLENKGIEFSIFTRPIVREQLNWTVGFNASYNENEITKLIASDDPDYPGVETGGIAGGVGNNIQIHSVGFPASSFYVYEQVYGTDGKPIQGMYVDRNGDGEISGADRYHYEKPAADFWFGLNSTVAWKNWEFSFSGRANFGNYVYNNVASENGIYERLYRPEGPYLSNIAAYVFNTEFVNPEYLSDYYIQDASFFRMDYMSLSYLFQNIGKSKLNLRVSGTVNNAFVITNYEGLDPEIQDGIDNNIYPRPRVFVLGVNLQF